jgi:hypothetical protein
MTTDISFSRIPADAAERWKVVRDVLAGDQAMRDGGYLPYLNRADKSEENIARNAAYVERAVFYGVTAHTLNGLLGLAFRKDPRTELPPKLESLRKDVDGSGVSIYQQSQMVLANVLSAGRHGLYVDFAAGMNRAVIKSYDAESIINWPDPGETGPWVLKETVNVRDGYGLRAVTQYRELTMEDGKFVCRVHRETDEGKTALHEEITPKTRSGALRSIPFLLVGARNNDTQIDKAPLYDLARLNVAHYRNSADYEDSVFYNGQAQPYIAGLTEEWRDHLEKSEKMYVGARSPLLLPSGGSFGFAQPGANTLVREAMDQKEKQMVALGARVLDPDAIATTATQNENDREGATSALSLSVSNVNEAYQQCVRWCADYHSHTLTDDQALGAYKISQDFSRRKIDPSVLQALVSAWQAGAYSKIDVRAFLREEGVIAAERTDEQIDDDLGQEGPSLGTLGGGDE